ncbi:pyridoxamine 5'-phosphate oxidase family protein [Actinopolymorpha sp. B17G11]|uniref:pyridoxamine 5'-phosphate oxidase family protein n=1 Tax=Actinopolymorpha sp. B17G11 TaxID=3160861 RepID=UPI0032E4D552
MRTPEAAPPRMFGSVVPSDLLPWGWAEERLTTALNYWVATASAAGRPHVRPVWGVWLDDSFVFAAGSPVAAANLAGNTEATVHLESSQDVVIVEGAGERVVDGDELQRYVDANNHKYDYRAFVAGESVAAPGIAPGPAYRVRPRVVYGWEAELHNPTRWSWST